MKVLFLQPLPGIPRGSVRAVRDGYARNYLFPKNIARPATPERLREIETELVKKADSEKRDTERFNAVLKQLEKQPLNFRMKANAKGKLFGSVTAEDISKLIHERGGVVVDPSWIHLSDPLRNVGETSVVIAAPHLHHRTIAIRIEPE